MSFSGTFNGTLKTDGSGNIQKEYCSDPAWVLYDLLTESRAGFGDFVDGTQIDKYAFYNASVYNSELITDGLGEHRLDLDVILLYRTKQKLILYWIK